LDGPQRGGTVGGGGGERKGQDGDLNGTGGSGVWYITSISPGFFKGRMRDGKERGELNRDGGSGGRGGDFCGGGVGRMGVQT